MPLLFDPLYMMIMLPCIILALWAQAKVSSAFQRYSRIQNCARLTGAQVARMILDRNDIRDVSVSMTQTHLGDHYNPVTKELKLSPDVYGGDSVASLGIAAHEVGHAIQHATGYPFLRFRSAWVPIASYAHQLSFFFILGGMMINATGLTMLGVICFSAFTLFTLVTLPVELNASSRAVALLSGYGVIRDDEEKGVCSVLNAAALTYLAAFFTALMQLIYYIMIMNRQRD